MINRTMKLLCFYSGNTKNDPKTADDDAANSKSVLDGQLTKEFYSTRKITTKD